jgi:hypothetical protein
VNNVCEPGTLFCCLYEYVMGEPCPDEPEVAEERLRARVAELDRQINGDES